MANNYQVSQYGGINEAYHQALDVRRVHAEARLVELRIEHWQQLRARMCNERE
jgi:hypothetical protein